MSSDQAKIANDYGSLYRLEGHLNDGLMLDVQVWMPTGSGDDVYEGGYTPVVFEWEPLLNQSEGVHDKKIKAVKVVVKMTSDIRGQKGFDICCLGHLMRLCSSGGLWVRKKILILIGTWKRFTKIL
ncbi:hypothetical protein ACLOJK_004516 [Asimina triloba]